MKTRVDLYAQEAESILRDISMYHVLTRKQIFALFPGKDAVIENLLAYLVKQGRIRQGEKNPDLYMGISDHEDEINTGLMAAVWILTEFIDEVEYHSVCDYPTMILFFAHGEVYEIIYVEQGREALVNSLFARPSQDPSHYLVVVDTETQIPRIKIPNIAGFCTVTKSGEVQYFKKE